MSFLDNYWTTGHCVLSTWQSHTSIEKLDNLSIIFYFSTEICIWIERDLCMVCGYAKWILVWIESWVVVLWPWYIYCALIAIYFISRGFTITSTIDETHQSLLLANVWTLVFVKYVKQRHLVHGPSNALLINFLIPSCHSSAWLRYMHPTFVIIRLVFAHNLIKRVPINNRTMQN